MTSLTTDDVAIVFLDVSGDSVLPRNVVELASERDFLISASQPHFTQKRYLVRGSSLCQWAREWCEGRSYPIEFARSPREAWRQLHGTWTETDITKLQQLSDSVLPAPGGVHDTLFLLFPSGPWNEPPSFGHAVRWCIWLETSFIDQQNPALPLILVQTEQWREQLENYTGKDQEYRVALSAYRLQTASEANLFLHNWFIKGTAEVAFPFAIPDKWKNKAKQAWQFCPQDEGGHNFWQRINAGSYPHSLRTIAAEIISAYLKHHPHEILPPLLASLRPFLDATAWQQLERLCRPTLPSLFLSDASPADALAWVRDEYLPYRHWQVLYGSEKDRSYTADRAAEFAQWLLSFYPQAIAGGNGHAYLAIAASAQMQSSSLEPNGVVLWIIPDGLTLSDGQQLRELLQDESRLSLAEDRMLLTTLPTITCFCKPALMNGCPPDLMDITETPSPRSSNAFLLYDKTMRATAAEAKPGQILIWTCHNEPDSTYHKNKSRETTSHEVAGKLHTIVQQIRELIEAIPPNFALRVVVTTDHGRLLSDDAARLHSLPPGAKSEGRAAWGSFEGTPPQGLVALPSDAFRLPSEYTVWVASDADAFVQNDGKGGYVAFAHGGLWPEEVTVPWLSFVRDAHSPILRLLAEGTGRSGGAGSLNLTFDNAENVPVSVLSLHLQTEGNTWQWNLPPSGTVIIDSGKTFTIEQTIQRWPSEGECTTVTGTAVVALPNGLRFDVVLEVALTAETLSKQNLTAADLFDL